MKRGLLKMKKRITIAIIVSISVLMLAACAGGGAGPSSPGEETTAEPEVTGPVIISIAEATDELLKKYDTYIEYNTGAEFAVNVLISTNTMVRDFSYIEVGAKEENDQFVFYESAVLLSLPKLLPEEPLLTDVIFPGMLPVRGITYLDENDVKRYFAISMSGEDGSVFLFEF